MSPAQPQIDPDFDLDTLGLNFSVKAPVVQAEPEIKQAVVVVKPEDERTNEDIKAELLQHISNALDLPEAIIGEARTAMIAATGELRDFIMNQIVPTVLAINPAIMSVQQMVPRMFDNGDETPVDMQADQLAGFARATATLATKCKIVEMLGLSDDVRQRLLLRMIPVTDKERPA